MLETYLKWLNQTGNENNQDNFSIFYQEYSYGKTFFMMLNDLAWEIVNLDEEIEKICC